MSRRRWGLLVLSALALALGACRDDGNTTRFTSDQIQALRGEVQRLGTGRFEKMGPSDCQRSPIDPNDLMGAFPRLRLRQGFALRAYHCRMGGDAGSKVFAMPMDAKVPEPPGDSSSPYTVRVPPGALENPMTVVQGDDSPESYLQASLLQRELTAFGALWHPGVHGFGGTTILGPPWSTAEPSESNGLVFDKSLVPRDWSPSVRMTKESVVVVLYARPFSLSLVRYEDIYPRGSYVSTTVTKVVAKSTRRPPMT